MCAMRESVSEVCFECVMRKGVSEDNSLACCECSGVLKSVTRDCSVCFEGILSGVRFICYNGLFECVLKVVLKRV